MDVKSSESSFVRIQREQKMTKAAEFISELARKKVNAFEAIVAFLKQPSTEHVILKLFFHSNSIW